MGPSGATLPDRRLVSGPGKDLRLFSVGQGMGAADASTRHIAHLQIVGGPFWKPFKLVSGQCDLDWALAIGRLWPLRDGPQLRA